MPAQDRVCIGCPVATGAGMAWLVPEGGGDGDVVEDEVGGEVEVEDVVGCGDDDGLRVEDVVECGDDDGLLLAGSFVVAGDDAGAGGCC